MWEVLGGCGAGAGAWQVTEDHEPFTHFAKMPRTTRSGKLVEEASTSEIPSRKYVTLICMYVY